MTDRSLDDLHPDLKILCLYWLDKCHAQSINAVVYFTWRSVSEQDALYAQGRTAPGKIVTNARGGQSKHNFTLPDGTPASKAFDFFIARPDGSENWDWQSPEWQGAISIGKGLGLQWGGDWTGGFKDYDHFQIS